MHKSAIKLKKYFSLCPYLDVLAVFTQVDRQERDSHHCQCQCASVYLGTVKLTFFLLGSNLAREEIIVTKCGVSLLRHVEPVQKHRPVVGRVMSQPMNLLTGYNLQLFIVYMIIVNSSHLLYSSYMYLVTFPWWYKRKIRMLMLGL